MSKRTEWFEKARFGMFIHWGVYSLPGRGEWVMFLERIPKDDYEKLGKEFKPDKYNPEEWVKLAKESGMKYIVLTTRHHDGYSLFDSKVSDFTAPKTGPGRDLIAEYVSACRKYGMKIGFYYSLIDWRWDVAWQGPEKNPSGWNKLVEYVHKQVEELMSNYGKIDILWYDGSFYLESRKSFRTTRTKPEHWKSKKLNKMVRKLQPDIIINNRSDLPEDFDTPEQRITPSEKNRLWESCMTMNYHWGYCASDNLWKPAKELAQNLSSCVSGGGNYLLNVGPKANGEIPEESVIRLKEIGRWLKKNGEAIYGAGKSGIFGGSCGVLTKKGKKLYLFVHWWSGRNITLPDVKDNIKRAYFLHNKKKVEFEKNGRKLVIKNLTPKKPSGVLIPVIVLEKT